MSLFNRGNWAFLDSVPTSRGAGWGLKIYMLLCPVSFRALSYYTTPGSTRARHEICCRDAAEHVLDHHMYVSTCTCLTIILLTELIFSLSYNLQ